MAIQRVSLATAALLVAAAPLLAASGGLHPSASFEEYLELFGRGYHHGSDEGRLRRPLFEERSLAARRQNEKPGALWRAALNAFSDRTEEELRSMNGWRATSSSGRRSLGMMEDARAELPANFTESTDWSHLKSLSAADQGGCGSCWAVAATYLLRSHYEIKTNSVKEFSAQQIVNCVRNPLECGGQGGCTGATTELALEYVQNISLDQLPVEGDVPYVGQDQACDSAPKFLATHGRVRGGLRQHDFGNTGASVSLASFQKLPANQAVPLLEALVDGPVAISMAAQDLFAYSNGVFDGCRDWVISHAVVMVGFGEDSGTMYWKLKNSWGAHWGEEGYFRLVRKSVEKESSNCGWDTNPAAGIACKPYPEKELACGACGVLFDPVVLKLETA